MGFRTAFFTALVWTTFSLATATAQTPQSPQVQAYLQQANHAGALLERGDLAGMEAALEPGFSEIALMMSNYRSDERTNLYLRERGWGHLVWTQLMYRLLAMRSGLYAHELEFAESVAVQEVAESSLETVQMSHTRLQVLLAAIDKMELDQDINNFARALLDGGPTYQELVQGFETRYARSRKAVLVRLATGIHRRFVDPAELPNGTEYAQAYAAHRERLAGENRMDEVLNLMAATDPGEIQRLAGVVRTSDDPQERDSARNELRLQLLLVEDALDAYENDASVADWVRYVDQVERLGDVPCLAYPDDVQTVMTLVDTAQRKMREQAQPENLRGLYTMAELVR